MKPIRPVLTLLALACAAQVFIAQACAQTALIAALKDGSGKRVLVTAHRAVHDTFPENSMAAIDRAIKLGVDVIEIDVRLTSDGVPVLMHDATVDRMTDGQGKVKELTFAQIEALHLKGANGAVTSYRVPTLDEALRAAKGKILVDLDLKTGDVEPTLSRVIETGVLGQVLFFNDNYDYLKKFRALAPDVLIFPRAHSTEEAGVAAATFRPEVIHIDDGFNTDATHQAAQATDSRLWINALGEPDKLVAAGKVAQGVDPLLAHGVSMIQTDHPAAIIAYLKSIGRR